MRAQGALVDGAALRPARGAAARAPPSRSRRSPSPDRVPHPDGPTADPTDPAVRPRDRHPRHLRCRDAHRVRARPSTCGPTTTGPPASRPRGERCCSPRPRGDDLRRSPTAPPSSATPPARSSAGSTTEPWDVAAGPGRSRGRPARGSTTPARGPLVHRDRGRARAVWGEAEGGRSLAVTPSAWARAGSQAAQEGLWAQVVALAPDADTPRHAGAAGVPRARRARTRPPGTWSRGAPRSTRSR